MKAQNEVNFQPVSTHPQKHRQVIGFDINT